MKLIPSFSDTPSPATNADDAEHVPVRISALTHQALHDPHPSQSFRGVRDTMRYATSSLLYNLSEASSQSSHVDLQPRPPCSSLTDQ